MQRDSFAFLLMAMLCGVVFAACGEGFSESPAGGCETADCGPGQCAVQGGQAVCLCPSGYIADGLSCIPDPCDPDPCVYGICRISGASVFCQCDQGYGGELCDRCADGYHASGAVCLPGDPCDDDPCIFGLCSKVEGETVCTCDAGYAGDRCDRCAEGYHPENLACVSDGGVASCTPNPCIHGSCRDTPNGAACDCDPGYAGATCADCAEGYRPDGLACLPIPGDPCDPNPCGEPHQTQCLDNGGVAVCACDPGYVWDGAACAEQAGDPCEPNPCDELHKTVCVSVGGASGCLCDEGYRDNGDGECVEDATSIPTRVCGATVRYQSAGAGPIYIRGEFNSWALSDPLMKNGAVWELTIDDLAVGDYAYKLFDQSSNQWFLDPNNPYTKYVDGTPNSRLMIPDCDKPLLELDSQPQVEGGAIRFAVAASYGRSRFALDASTARAVRNGEALSDAFDPATGVFTINEDDLPNGKHTYRFEIADVQGNEAEPVTVPVWIEAAPFDWRDGAMYFVLTDRFKDGDSRNNAPTQDSQLDYKANWQGGDFAGVIDKIEDGYFTDMGINVLWISSPVMNTQGAFWGSDGHKYTGYHSYWPISTGWADEFSLPGVQPIEPHFGSLDEFKALVEAAHARGIRVIADFVANHVHSDSPVYTQHINESEPWFNWDGAPGTGYVCGWERPIECWFADYLPDFDYRSLEVMKLVMNHAVWLIRETGIDGFRLDAVKHMVLDFSQTLRAEIDAKIDTVDGIRFYMVGETFTGEGDGAKQTIKAYVGRQLLDGQFDFPLFWMAVKAFLRQETGLDGLRGFMDGNDGYYGPDAVMSNFMGNHDVARALSHAAGQIGDLWGNGAKEQGWSNPPQAPGGSDAYKKLRQAWTFLFTQNQIPLVYYGDEIGMPGAGDPDNRRFMRFGGDLSANERATLEHVRKVGQARRRHAALRTGQRQTLKVDGTYWAYVMKSGDDKVLVIFNRGNSRTETLNVGQSGMADGTYKDIFGGRTITVSGGSVSVGLGALESAVYEWQ
ncbi:MAG: hypothetical protein C4523_07410 [Myxococcales bacterium]|nr:MAG: hypothetical protein C4523_07410 [Myxococcales bacterium]